jgi:hypothetical protein
VTDVSEQLAVIPIFPAVDGIGHETLLVKRWCPGYGSGDQAVAWCLGKSSSQHVEDRSGLTC